MRRTGVVLVCSMVLTVPAGSASAAEVRFLHAVPGAESAELTIGDDASAPASFGDITPYFDAADGEVELSVLPAGGGDPLVEATETLGDGRYTIVAWQRGGEGQLALFRDGEAVAGKARLRVLSVAGELGETDALLGERPVVRSITPGDASEYASAEPGSYELRIVRSGEGGDPLVTRPVELVAGTASTAVVVGSRGEPLRIVLASDDSVAPEAGPRTGLGGLSDGDSPWALALSAALLAGALGGGVYALRARRRRA